MACKSPQLLFGVMAPGPPECALTRDMMTPLRCRRGEGGGGMRCDGVWAESTMGDAVRSPAWPVSDVRMGGGGPDDRRCFKATLCVGG